MVLSNVFGWGECGWCCLTFLGGVWVVLSNLFGWGMVGAVEAGLLGPCGPLGWPGASRLLSLPSSRA